MNFGKYTPTPKGGRRCHPKICHFGIRMELKALEYQQRQEKHSDPPPFSQK